MKLLRHFGSLDNLLKAGASEIAEVEGINKKLANTIHDYLEKTV
jgi:excinuclease ABC subunit C